MENDINKSKFYQYLDMVCSNTLIQSLIFSLDIKDYIERVELDDINQQNLLKALNEYININKDEPIFDEFVKDNIYILMDHIYEQDKKTDNVEKINLINNIKINLNIASDDNVDFLRQQMILRDYGYRYYNLNLAKISRFQDEFILSLREYYYNSISNDYIILGLILSDEVDFNNNYKPYLLEKTFYRSVNYLMSVYRELFYYKPEYLDKVKFIINENLNILTSATDDSEIDNIEEIDDDFFCLANATQKMVKKIEREIK